MGTTYGKKRQKETEAAYARMIGEGKELDWEAIREAAMHEVHGDTMTAAQIKRIKDARAALRAKKKVEGKPLDVIDFSKGYGTVVKSKGGDRTVTPAATAAGRGGVTETPRDAFTIAAENPTPEPTPTPTPPRKKGPTTKTAGGRRVTTRGGGTKPVKGKPGSLKYAQNVIKREESVQARKHAEALAGQETARRAAALRRQTGMNPGGRTIGNDIVEALVARNQEQIKKGAARQAAFETEELQVKQAARTKTQAKKRKKLVQAGWKPKKPKQTRGGGITGR